MSGKKAENAKEFRGQPLQDRKDLFKQLNERYTDKVCIILEDKNSKTNFLEKYSFKYIVSKDTVFGHFIREFRKSISFDPSIGLFFYVRNGTVSASLSSTIEFIYNKFKDEDGFLYVQFVSENTFG